jgi:hypothetical protein
MSKGRKLRKDMEDILILELHSRVSVRLLRVGSELEMRLTGIAHLPEG